MLDKRLASTQEPSEIQVFSFFLVFLPKNCGLQKCDILDECRSMWAVLKQVRATTFVVFLIPRVIARSLCFTLGSRNSGVGPCVLTENLSACCTGIDTMEANGFKVLGFLAMFFRSLTGKLQ